RVGHGRARPARPHPEGADRTCALGGGRHGQRHGRLRHPCLGRERSTAMVAAGVAMLVLGLYVMAQFTEHRFVPARKQHRRHASVIFRRGVFLARRDRKILLILAATFLVNGAAEAFERLYPARLVDLNFPTEQDPIVWFTALGVVSFAVGALVLRMVEARIDGAGVARRVYAAACPTGSMGLILLA
ncbi:MAG: hypothetical protein M3P51_08115, partial [Chloroflexota bacterium]|nr:hypothetical protein [Chloroflexota bacterium]